MKRWQLGSWCGAGTQHVERVGRGGCTGRSKVLFGTQGRQREDQCWWQSVTRCREIPVCRTCSPWAILAIRPLLEHLSGNSGGKDPRNGYVESQEAALGC